MDGNVPNAYLRIKQHPSERFQCCLLYVGDGQVTQTGVLDVHDALDHDAQVCPESRVRVSRHSWEHSINGTFAVRLKNNLSLDHRKYFINQPDSDRNMLPLHYPAQSTRPK